MEKIAAFGLVRGYPGHQAKWRYSQVVLRNYSILLQALIKRESWDLILFHEGNISALDRKVLNFLALGQIKFVDVADTFRKPRELLHTGSYSPLGYALMCRFNYYGIWRHLVDYDVAMRVDEDCFLIRVPKLRGQKGFVTAATCAETHTTTNNTLPLALELSGDAHHYSHNFPYTNFYITNPKLWSEKPVQEFLETVAKNPMCLEYRWGDIPVLGVALSKFSETLGPFKKDPSLIYLHLSHLTFVRQGNFKSARFVLDIKRPLHSVRSIFKSLTRTR